MEEFANFDFNIWRKRYIQWISHLKSRILDVFRSIDRDQDGRITHKEFVDYVLASSKIKSTHVGWTENTCIWNTSEISLLFNHNVPVLTSLAEFPTNSLEMNAVANIFDMNNDGFIDYYEFVSALHPSRDPYRKALDADQINEEVCRRNAKNAWLSALRLTFFFFPEGEPTGFAM